jgi:hypothetical protein
MRPGAGLVLVEPHRPASISGTRAIAEGSSKSAPYVEVARPRSKI